MESNGSFQFKPSDDFGYNVSKLLNILKNIMKSHNKDIDDLTKAFGDFKADQNQNSANLNVYFFNFMPLHPDELEEISDELEEVFEDELAQDPYGDGELKFEINSNDKEFLKKHGISF